MAHSNQQIVSHLRAIDLGSSIAEQDTLLENARVDTSAFSDLLEDKVDLIPGSKGSGKSALYRIIVDFMPSFMLRRKRVVVAHGVRQHGDQVFQVFKDRFGRLNEDGFTSFWCVYLISLAHEHFIKEDSFSSVLSQATDEVHRFQSACRAARIPSFEGKRSLRDVLDWALDAVLALLLKKMKVAHHASGMEGELELFEHSVRSKSKIGETPNVPLPVYAQKITDALHAVLEKCDLSLWLMIDRLDEIFPRRSALETRALRGLLRVIRIFESPRVRVKIFLRDDILEQIVEGKGFTALTHVAARRAKPLAWTEDQILSLLVRRIFAHKGLASYLNVEAKRLDSIEYSKHAFYQIFPNAVYRGDRKISTLRWIYSRCADGRGVVTPRDVIDLVTKAIQHQVDLANGDITGASESMVTPPAIRAGYFAMSKDKTVNYLRAEFPQWWSSMEKFRGGKTAYTEFQLHRLFGNECDRTIKDLVSVGLLAAEKRRAPGSKIYKIPFLYRPGLETTQGQMRY